MIAMGKRKSSKEELVLLLLALFRMRMFKNLSLGCLTEYITLCMHAKSLQSCLTLCHPMNCNPPGSSARGIFQARILAWVALPFSRGSSPPGIDPVSLRFPALAGEFFITSVTWETHVTLAKHNLISFLKPRIPCAIGIKRNAMGTSGKETLMEIWKENTWIQGRKLP